ncbi:MAG: DUF3800 domain-containing protein [Anaerolineales bacterium]|nr:DUF3800 domain-containing protein [Chloroflexota bacterium]
MITFTFAGDEAGDVSFSFSKGASRYFVVAVVATSKPDHLRAMLEKVRKDFNLAQTYEFGFNSVSSARLREHVFTVLGNADFEAWALIVDKTTLPDTFSLFMSGLDVYVYFISELIRQIPVEKRAHATLILDEYGDPTQTREELKKVLKKREIKHGFQRITIRRSKSEPLIQIADLVAGSILRRDTHNESGAFDLIARKVRHVIEYH